MIQGKTLEDQHHQCLSPSLNIIIYTPILIAVFLVFSGIVKNKETKVMDIPSNINVIEVGYKIII